MVLEIVPVIEIVQNCEVSLELEIRDVLMKGWRCVLLVTVEESLNTDPVRVDVPHAKRNCLEGSKFLADWSL